MQKKISTFILIKMSMCVALCCVTAYLAFPLPFTPGMVTALTISMSLTAYILNPRQTFTVIFIYLLMGAVGIPVFAGGSGLGKILGPVGGFYFAWLIAYPVLSKLKGEEISLKRYVLMNVIATMPITYAGGLISMIIVLKIDLLEAFTMAVLPYILGDVLKAVAAAFIAVKLNSIKNFQEN